MSSCSTCSSVTIRYCEPCRNWFCRECWIVGHPEGDPEGGNSEGRNSSHKPILPPPDQIRSGFGIVNAGATYQFSMKRWLKHSTYRVLTFDSSSCITLVATLRDGIEPFFFTHTRSNEPLFTKPTRTMLVKLMLTNNKITKQIRYTNKRLQKQIYVQPVGSFVSECAIQRDICQKSMTDNHPCDPLCPQIYWSSDKLTEEGSFGSSQVSGFFGNNHSPSIICMEWLEGYNTFKYHWKMLGLDFSILSNELAYEMMRLLSYGYVHTDLNIENIMYNPDIYDHYGKGEKGKLKIIDFGRVRRTSPIPLEQAFSHVTRQQIFATNSMPFPDEKKVCEIIKYRKGIKHDEFLTYGGVYKNDIEKYGYDSNDVSSIISFLQNTLFKYIK